MWKVFWDMLEIEEPVESIFIVVGRVVRLRDAYLVAKTWTRLEDASQDSVRVIVVVERVREPRRLWYHAYLVARKVIGASEWRI